MLCVDLKSTFKYVPYRDGYDRASSTSDIAEGLEASKPTRYGYVRFLLKPPRRLASTAPGKGLSGGRLEGSCGWRRRRSRPKASQRRHVDALLSVSYIYNVRL